MDSILSIYWIWFCNYSYASYHLWGNWVKGTQIYTVLFFVTSSESITIFIYKSNKIESYLTLCEFREKMESYYEAF